MTYPTLSALLAAAAKAEAGSTYIDVPDTNSVRPIRQARLENELLEATRAAIPELESLLARLTWQPIDTLPCDDRIVLAWYDRGGHYDLLDADHDSSPQYWKERGWTHWLLLPEAPAAEVVGEK